MRAVLLAILIALILKLMFFDFIIAQGHSMEPSIKNGTVLVISRVRYGIRLPWRQNYIVRWSQPQVGEVVVFYTPTGELAIKRCVSIEANGYIMEGDNSLSSYDSRSYGPVLADKIIGKVLGY